MAVPFTDIHLPFVEYGLRKTVQRPNLYNESIRRFREALDLMRFALLSILFRLRRSKGIIPFGILKGVRSRAMLKSERYFVELINKLKLLKSFGILKPFLKGLRPPAGRPGRAAGGVHG